MQLVLPLAVVALASLAAPFSVQESQAPPARALVSEVFPPASAGITLRVDAEKPKSSMTIAQMLDELTRVTGVTVLLDSQSAERASRVVLGLNRSVEVPASEVHRIVGALLRAHEFLVLPLSDREPRIWKVRWMYSNEFGQQARGDARTIEERELDLWAEQPAALITVTIALPSTDVRTLANSMRTMFTDANTQNIVPVGTHGLVVVGFAPDVRSLVRLLHAIDAASAAAADAGAQPK